MSTSKNSLADDGMTLSIRDGILNLKPMDSSFSNCFKKRELMEMPCVIGGENSPSNRYRIMEMPHDKAILRRNNYERVVLILTSRNLNGAGQSDISLFRNPEGNLLEPVFQHLVLEGMPNGCVVGSCCGYVLLLDVAVRSFFLYYSFAESDSRWISFPTDHQFERYAVGIGHSSMLGDVRVLLILYLAGGEELNFVYSVNESCWKSGGDCHPADVSGYPAVFHGDALFFVNQADFGIVTYNLNLDCSFVGPGNFRKPLEQIRSRRLGVIQDEVVIADVFLDGTFEVYKYYDGGFTVLMYTGSLYDLTSLIPVAVLLDGNILYVVNHSYLGTVVIDEDDVSSVSSLGRTGLLLPFPLFGCVHYGGFSLVVNTTQRYCGPDSF